MANRDLDDLRDAEFAILVENAVSPNPHVSLDQCFEVGEALRWPDTRDRLAPQYKLSRSVKQVNDGLPQGGRHQRRMVDLLNVTAMLALDSLPFGRLLRDDRQPDVVAAPLSSMRCARLDYRWPQVIDDPRRSCPDSGWK